MKITTYTIVFVLIGGILSSANTQSVEDELKSLCTKNGGHWAYQDLLSVFPLLSRCYTPVMNEVLTEFRRSNRAIDYALIRFCGKDETLRRCVKTAMDTVKSCVEPHIHKTIIEVIYNIAASMLEIVCHDSAHLKMVFSSPGRQCIDSKLQAVKYCFTKIIISRNTSGHERLTPETDPLVILSLLKNQIDSQDCSEIQNFEQCSVEVLQECRYPIYSEILDAMYNYINHDIPCNDLPKLPRSKISPGILSINNPRRAIQSLCIKNGGPRSYTAFESSWPNLRQCFASVLDERLRKILESSDQMNATVTVYCDELESLKNCIGGFTDVFKSCLAQDQHELIDIGYNIISSASDFACENRKIVEAYFSGNDQCLDSKLEAVRECGYNFIRDRNITIPNGSLTKSDALLILSKLKIDFDDKTCRDLHHLERCSVKVLKGCERKAFSKTLNSLYKYINNNIPCNNLPKSEATPGSVVHALILLISVIIAIFL